MIFLQANACAVLRGAIEVANNVAKLAQNSSICHHDGRYAIVHWTADIPQEEANRTLANPVNRDSFELSGAAGLTHLFSILVVIDFQAARKSNALLVDFESHQALALSVNNIKLRLAFGTTCIFALLASNYHLRAKLAGS